MKLFVFPFVVYLLGLHLVCLGAGGARQTLDEARRLASEGRYEEALQKYIWFHDHELERDPILSGALRSLALSDWVELGAKYPKALRGLEDIRDKKAGRLLASEKNEKLFAEVLAINRMLGQSEATVELYRKIGEADPQFAKQVYRMVKYTLPEAGEYGLARRYMGDPAEKLTEAREALRPWQLPPGKVGPSLRRREEVFTREILELVDVLYNSGDLEAARKMQTDAAGLVETPLLRDVILNSTAGDDAQWRFESLTRSEALELALSALKTQGVPRAEHDDTYSKWAEGVRGVRDERGRYWRFEFDFKPNHPGTDFVLVYDDRDVNIFGAR